MSSQEPLLMDCEIALSAFHELLKTERLKCPDKQQMYSLRKDGGLLSDLHKAVFRGCWQSQPYKEMAKVSGYKKGSLSTEASRLFELVLQLLEIEVCKETFYQQVSPRLQPLITEAQRDIITKKIDNREFQQQQAKALSELSNLLSRYGDAIVELQRQACRRVMLDRGGIKTLPTLPELNSDPPLLTIQKLPPSQDRYSALEQFAGYLLVLGMSNGFVEDLQTWGTHYYASSWGDLIQEIHQRNRDYRLNAQPSLLIEITPCTVAKEGQYRIEAWYVKDIGEYRDTGRGDERLRPAAVSEEASYSLSEIRELLPLYLEHLPDDGNDPEIQLFLPGVLVDESVEQWPSCLVGNDAVERLGVDYFLSVRLGERLNRSSKLRRSWKRRWRECENILDVKDCGVFLTAMDEDGGCELPEDSATEGTQTVGLKLTSSSDVCGTDDLLRTLLETGLPLAIWCRKSVPGVDLVSSLDELLTCCTLRELPRMVQKIRQDVDIKDRDTLQLGTVISLIWDDPYLVPPHARKRTA